MVRGSTGHTDPEQTPQQRSGSRGVAWRSALLGLLLLGLLGALPFPQAVAWSATAETATRTELPHAQVVRRTLRTDPSQVYLAYVPRAGGEGARMFVDTHGYSRNIDEHATLLSPYAEAHGVVLIAPSFDRELHDDYQRLGRKGHGRRADHALDAIVTEVASLTGADAGSLYLFGFSGGAQFAHRYAFAHPERVAGVVVAAPGWYTFPDAKVDYPYGLGLDGELPGVHFDLDAILRVPITVVVGTDDLGSKNLRRNARVDRQQGTTRLARARRWTRAMQRAAAERGLPTRVTCIEVPHIGHSFATFMKEGGLGDLVFDSLFGASP